MAWNGLTRFTLHSATIKTHRTWNSFYRKKIFTLHSATIKTDSEEKQKNIFRNIYITLCYYSNYPFCIFTSYPLINLHYTLLLLKRTFSLALKLVTNDLHYTLLLLKLRKAKGLVKTKTFTLHSATIKTTLNCAYFLIIFLFTLHSATIKTFWEFIKFFISIKIYITLCYY